MKILKPGKVEQRKFVCPKCDCIFVVDKTEMKYSLGTDYVVCPFCGNAMALTWKYGEPYEEPTQDARTDRERLQPLLHTMPGYQGRTGEGADYLIANGVTFRD